MLVIIGSLFTAGMEKNAICHPSSGPQFVFSRFQVFWSNVVPLLQINQLKKLVNCDVKAGSSAKELLLHHLCYGESKVRIRLCQSLKMNVLFFKITFSRAVKMCLSATRGRWSRSGVLFHPFFFLIFLEKK